MCSVGRLAVHLRRRPQIHCTLISMSPAEVSGVLHPDAGPAVFSDELDTNLFERENYLI
jgi:hypothetical protein